MSNTPPGLEEFLKLVEHYGLSPDNPEDGWRMAAILFKKHHGAKVAKPGVKADPHDIAVDLLLMAVVEEARRDGDRRGVAQIIRELAKANDWRTDDQAIETMRRRYQYLKDPKSRHRKRADELARSMRDMFAARLAELAKKPIVRN